MKKLMLSAAAAAVAACAAHADYPDRAINMLVPFGAGGGTDVPARFFAAELEKILGQNIIVSNVEGAGGTVGATQLSQADPDGYNLGFLPVGTTTTQPHLKKTSYNADSWTPSLHGQPGSVLSCRGRRQSDPVLGGLYLSSGR